VESIRKNLARGDGSTDWRIDEVGEDRLDGFPLTQLTSSRRRDALGSEAAGLGIRIAFRSRRDNRCAMVCNVE
jgi:hypothetical protein